MSNTAAHLVDHIIAPDVTLRQWVLTVPFELRLLLAAKPDALSAVGRIFIQEIQRWQRQQAAALGFERAEGAAVSFCQRFGSSLNLNIHWHVIVPDALFVPDATSERVDTLKHRAPTRLDLEEIVTTVATRCVRWLEKQGYVRREDEEDPTNDSNNDSPWMRCLQGSLGVGELQRWAEHGRTDETADPARARSLPRPTKGLGAQHLKFNLHAGVSVPGGLPAARERLIRYCARPPPALERLSVLEDGRICYRIKDTEQVRLMTPTQFMARLAALVAPPRHPLVRFYGVWAPHSRWRSRVVTAAPKKKRSTCSDQKDSIRSLRSSCRRHPRRGRDGATAGPERRPVRVRNAAHEFQAPGPVSHSPASSRCGASRSVARRDRRAAVHTAIALGLGHPLPEGLRHRPSRVLELRRTDALRRSDRGRRPSAQRTPPSQPARRATAAVSSAVTRLDWLKRRPPVGV